MADVERVIPGQRIWRRPNEEQPPQHAPGKGHDGAEPEPEPEPPDETDDGHIDVFVRPSTTPTTPP